MKSSVAYRRAPREQETEEKTRGRRKAAATERLGGTWLRSSQFGMTEWTERERERPRRTEEYLIPKRILSCIVGCVLPNARRIRTPPHRTRAALTPSTVLRLTQASAAPSRALHRIAITRASRRDTDNFALHEPMMCLGGGEDDVGRGDWRVEYRALDRGRRH